jgi:hypothetical protein
MKPSDLWPVGWRRTGYQRHALIACVLVFVLAPRGALALGAAVSGFAPPAAAMVMDDDQREMLTVGPGRGIEGALQIQPRPRFHD